MKTPQFRTHSGEIITGPRLTDAINAVADDWANLSHAIRRENAYASHVPDAKKESILQEGLVYAEEIRAGEHLNNFTIWQRVNEKLTGECIAFFGGRIARAKGEA